MDGRGESVERVVELDVEEVGLADGVVLRIAHPPDPMTLLDEEAFEREEYLPYWAELWPSAIVLARAVSAADVAGLAVLELGCGLGAPSVAAALGGADVLATDWSPDALGFAATNASANGAAMETGVCHWSSPDEVVERGPFDLVLAADVLYERRNVDVLLALLPRLVGNRGGVWVADPGRPHTEAFLATARKWWHVTSTPDERVPTVIVHRLEPT